MKRNIFQCITDLGENYWNQWLMRVHEEVCDKYVDKSKLMWFYKAKFNLSETLRV